MKTIPIEFHIEHPYSIASRKADIGDDAFIRSLPLSIMERERFAIDAIVLCSDIICAAYCQIIHRAADEIVRTDTDSGEPKGFVDVTFTQHAWSIVDQCYAIRNLVQALGVQGKHVDAFFSATEVVPEFRNRMDHLHQRIPNIANAKPGERNLFGSVSYIAKVKPYTGKGDKFFLVVHHPEPFRPNEEAGRTHFPDEIYFPIGNVTLSALGKNFLIDKVILGVRQFMVEFNREYESLMHRTLEEFAAEKGVSVEKLKEHLGGGLRLVMQVEIGKKPDIAESD